MEKIYSRINPDKLLHVINRVDDATNQRQDLTPEKEFLQVAFFSMEKGKSIKPHKHVEQIRTSNITQESWLVFRGKIKINLYDTDDKLLKESILNSGDCLVTFHGGHDFVVLDDNTVIYEYKTGPYLGKDTVGLDNNF